MVPPPAKNWEPELKMSERFLLRFYFVCFLFVWELLSPRWTATRSTFRLTMGSTATQSTGGKKKPTWNISQAIWLWFLGSWIGRIWKQDDGVKQTKLPLWRIHLISIHMNPISLNICSSHLYPALLLARLWPLEGSKSHNGRIRYSNQIMLLTCWFCNTWFQRWAGAVCVFALSGSFSWLVQY